MALPPLSAASNLALQASDTRESLPQLIFVALHATNLGQLLEDLPFFSGRKTLLERSLLLTDALGSRGECWRCHVQLTFRTLFRPSEAIFEEPPVEGGAGATYRLFHAL